MSSVVLQCHHTTLTQALNREAVAASCIYQDLDVCRHYLEGNLPWHCGSLFSPQQYVDSSLRLELGGLMLSSAGTNPQQQHKQAQNQVPAMRAYANLERILHILSDTHTAPELPPKLDQS